MSGDFVNISLSRGEALDLAAALVVAQVTSQVWFKTHEPLSSVAGDLVQEVLEQASKQTLITEKDLSDRVESLTVRDCVLGYGGSGDVEP